MMVSLNRLTTCDIPFGVEIGDICVFYWDNAEIGNAAWGDHDLDKWGVAAAASCPGNSDFNSIRDWIQNGYPSPLLLKQPPPTFVCIGTGTSERPGQPDQRHRRRDRPVPGQRPGPAGCLQRPPCPPPSTSCTLHKYAIVGFAKLKIIQLYDNRNKKSEWNQYCSMFVQNSNARCLVTQWQGYDDTGYVPGGQNFGYGSVGLKG